MSREFLRLSLALLAALLTAVSPVHAQARDAFVEGLVAFSQATAGTFGHEGPALRGALDRMREGLAQWDAAVARVESGFAGAVTSAAPREAAQMQATLGATLLERGRVAEALPHLDAAAVLDAAALHLLRGAAHLRAGERAAAASAFGRALALEPASSAALVLALDAARGRPPSREVDAAAERLAVAVATLAAGGRLPAVAAVPLDLLDDASVEEPLFPPSAYMPGVLLLRQAKYVEALASWQAAADADPLVTDAALATAEARAGAAALDRQDPRAAVQALQSVPGGRASSEVQRLIGVAYWSLEDYDSSAERLRASVRLDGRNERARIALADVLMASRNPAAARTVLLETIAALPSSGLAQWRLGRLLLEAADQAGALQAFEAASRLTPFAGTSLVFAAAGRLQHTRLALDAAAAVYERRAELTPFASAARLDLGAVYLAQGRADDALVQYQIAALLDPASAAAFAAVGQVRADAGHDQAALAMLERAIALDGSLLDARYAASRALLRLGRADEARQALAVFERLQREAMDAERRRFEENARTIEETLRGEPAGAGR